MGLLTDFRLTVMEKQLGVYGIHVYQKGKEPIVHRFRSDDRVNLYSASKTFTSVGVGIAIDEGLFGLDDFVLDFFPEFKSLASDGSEKITIRNLLQMSSGHSFSDVIRYNAMDRVALFFETELRYPVGSYFFYDNLAPYVLGRIIEKTSGLILRDYLKPRLFDPLEIINPQWHTCAEGHTLASSGLHLTTEELSRLGIMLLHEGVYKDKRIVSSAYIHQMHTDLVRTLSKDDPETQSGYGYQIWNCTLPNTYRADGMYGQMCVVLKDYDAVVTVTAHNEYEHKDILRAIWKDIVPHLNPA